MNDTMGKLRVKKYRNGLYSKGRIKPFQVYYMIEEWSSINGDYWDWYPIRLTSKENYERFKQTGECYINI